MFFLRRVSNKTSLIRAVALATAGSGTVYYNNISDVSVSVSIPSSYRDSFKSWPWRTMESNRPCPTFIHSNHSQFGVSSIFNSRPDSLPDPHLWKGASLDGSLDGGNGPKCPSNCLNRNSIANAAAKIAPAVVHLSVPRDFVGITRSIGSGTIINDDGTILTCAHVVLDFQGLRSSSREKLEVTLQDGRSFEGTVLNADLHSDIAIVKINSKTPLPTAKLGTSGKLRPGDWVVAVGCPMTLQNTVTAGIVSCIDRKSSDLGLGGMPREYLQTDCTIHKGNSGGPLVNVDGEVIGVNIMKLLGAEGINFAIPIDSVLTILNHFKTNGKVVRPWLGLKMIDLTDMIVARLKERKKSFPAINRGVLVSMVSPGSPAYHAGFLPGDIVVEFEGRAVESVNEIIEIMGDKVGKPFKAVVKRANDFTVTLTVIPEEGNPNL